MVTLQPIAEGEINFRKNVKTKIIYNSKNKLRKKNFNEE